MKRRNLILHGLLSSSYRFAFRRASDPTFLILENSFQYVPEWSGNQIGPKGKVALNCRDAFPQENYFQG